MRRSHFWLVAYFITIFGFDSTVQGIELDMHVANLLERAVENRRLTTLRTALLQQEQVAQEEIVLQERQGAPSLQEEHNLDILSSPLCHLK